MNNTVEQFIEDCRLAGIEINAGQANQFSLYYKMLIEWNERINLTAITEMEAVFTKHFLDSLLLATVPAFDPSGSMLDVGAGAGFPGIPAKIAFPSLPLTILDSLNKRIVFLNELLQLLQLKNCHAIHGRAEELGQGPQHRESYQQVTARAVAKLAVLCEYCLPFVKVGGYFFSLKGSDVAEEVQEAAVAVKRLGAKVEKTLTFSLPRQEGERSIIVIKKISPTPKQYPRRAGTPAKSPLLS